MSLLAALIFFTRLPFWRIAEVPAACFRRVVAYWPFVGWLTGGVMAATLWVASRYLSLPSAVLLACLSRLLVTGALHEDGLADFCDGFGGGSSREQILTIMKDSHIGTYGVLGLVFYLALLGSFLSSLSPATACLAMISGDAWSKACSAQIINLLPYARKEEESKAKVVYDRMDLSTLLMATAGGALPSILFLPLPYWWALPAPVLTSLLLIALVRKRLRGYTGDCCGAVFLLSELSFHLVITLIYHQSL